MFFYKKLQIRKFNHAIYLSYNLFFKLKQFKKNYKEVEYRNKLVT